MAPDGLANEALAFGPSPGLATGDTCRGATGDMGAPAARNGNASAAALHSDGPSAPPDPDADLVARATAGDRVAFDALLRRHYDRIHRLAWRLTGSRTEAQDVAQEVCCTLVERIASFKGEARFTTWLFGIVVNASRDSRRRGAVWSRVSASLSVLAGLARSPDGRDLYRQAWIASGLARLDPLLRDTVVLVVGEDMNHAEAGIALGVAESTVSWRMHEARKQLGGQS
jgi:RNA polymerase sigma-70 factor, ECF subfamily